MKVFGLILGWISKDTLAYSLQPIAYSLQPFRVIRFKFVKFVIND